MTFFADRAPANLIEAATILDQLGGREFILMTGSHTPVAQGRTPENPNPFIQVQLGSHEAGWRKLRVTLLPTDEYKMEFFRGDGEGENYEEFDGLQADQFAEIFTEVTGMDTRMPIIIKATQRGE